MNTIWNSLELLQKINSVSFWVLMFSLILGLISTYSMYAIGNRISELKDHANTQKELVSNEEKLKMQNQLESTKEQYSILENELQRTKQAQQEAEQKVAEELKITHERIEHSQNRIPPRRLSVDQKNKLFAALKNISNGSIAINYVMNNTESLNFAKELDSVFKTAQWNVEKFYSLYNLDQDFMGLVLVSRDQKSTPHFRDALVKIFTSIGFKVDTLYSIALSEEVGALILSVGKNPAILE